jgi:hypothetical protein
VQWKVGLVTHLVQIESRVCGEMKHLDKVGDHKTHHRLDHRDTLDTNLVSLMCDGSECQTCCAKRPGVEFIG